MQPVSSRIWTRVAVFISYDDNNYTTGTSYQMDIITVPAERCGKNERKRKDKQILGCCLRGEKVVEHEGDSDTNFHECDRGSANVRRS